MPDPTGLLPHLRMKYREKFARNCDSQHVDILFAGLKKRGRIYYSYARWWNISNDRNEKCFLCGTLTLDNQGNKWYSEVRYGLACNNLPSSE